MNPLRTLSQVDPDPRTDRVEPLFEPELPLKLPYNALPFQFWRGSFPREFTRTHLTGSEVKEIQLALWQSAVEVGSPFPCCPEADPP